MSYSGKRVFVTGGGGFIGSHLVESLVREGAEVKVLVRYNGRNDWGHVQTLPDEIISSCEVVLGDVRDVTLMRRLVAGQDTVFHLAALIGIPYSYVAPIDYVATNIEGTINILEAVRSEGVPRLVHTSTSETYGTAQYTPIDEIHPLQGQSPYSASKISADKMAESYYRSFGTPVITVRPFNTFGPRQSARAVIPAVISQLLLGAKKLELGDLRPVRDMTYVADTVAGFLAAGAAPDQVIGETINLGTGRGETIASIVAMILKALQLDVAIETAPERLRPENSEVFELVSANFKAKELLGWHPEVSLEEGISHTISYIRSHLHLFKPRYAI